MVYRKKISVVRVKGHVLQVKGLVLQVKVLEHGTASGAKSQNNEVTSMI